LLVEEQQQLAKLQNNFLNAEEAEMTKELLPRRHLDYLNYYLLILVFQFDRISHSKMIFRSVLRGNDPYLPEGLERGNLLDGNFHIEID